MKKHSKYLLDNDGYVQISFRDKKKNKLTLEEALLKLYLKDVKGNEVNSAWCLTLGDQSENGVGMEMLGNGLRERGFTIKEVTRIGKKFEKKGGVSEYIKMKYNGENALVLIMRNGVNVLLGDNEGEKKMVDEMKSFEWDKKKKMRGRVVNSLARYNVCFGNKFRESDIENGKGTIIAYNDVKISKKWKKSAERMVGEKEGFEMEGNNYYDVNKCYIGFHGDSERKKVLAASLSDKGVVREIRWKWFHNSKRVGDEYIVHLNSGDMYVMSEKASGFDWRKRSQVTLRHGAGVKGSKIFKQFHKDIQFPYE